ncbi:MAG: hypothetical protein N2Z70_00265, partial [Bdellovibrionaceae bacterium]|nr:hypothetical protein [Pseudobdellovibrionaceae bacterium]
GLHLSLLWEVMDHRWGANPLYYDRRGWFAGLYQERAYFIFDGYAESFHLPHLVNGSPTFLRQNIQWRGLSWNNMQLQGLLMEFAHQNRVERWSYEYNEIRSGLVLTNRTWWQIRAYYRVWTDQARSRLTGQEYQPFGLEAFIDWSY